MKLEEYTGDMYIVRLEDGRGVLVAKTYKDEVILMKYDGTNTSREEADEAHRFAAQELNLKAAEVVRNG